MGLIVAEKVSKDYQVGEISIKALKGSASKSTLPLLFPSLGLPGVGRQPF